MALLIVVTRASESFINEMLRRVVQSMRWFVDHHLPNATSSASDARNQELVRGSSTSDGC